MGKAYPPEVIPEVGVQLGAGDYLQTIEEMDDTQPTSTGKYQIKANLRVKEPVHAKGSPYFENFVIGTDGDPNADDPESWKGFAAGRYKQMLTKAGIEMSGDVDQDMQAAVGQDVGTVVVQSVEPALTKNGQPNPYAGRVRSQTQAFFRPGEREPKIHAQQDGEKATTRPGAPKAPAAPAKLPPKQAPQAQAPAPAKPGVTKPPAVKQIKCPVCSNMVNRAEYAAHYEAHEQAGGEEEE